MVQNALISKRVTTFIACTNLPLLVEYIVSSAVKRNLAYPFYVMSLLVNLPRDTRLYAPVGLLFAKPLVATE